MSVIRRRSYGIVPYAIGGDGAVRFLLLRAFRNWDFPKGGAQGAETPLEAARREMREETGIPDFEMPHGEACIDTEPYAGGKVATYFVARTRQRDLILPVNPELGRPEHDEFRWVAQEQARRMLAVRLHPVLDWAASVIAGRDGAH